MATYQFGTQLGGGGFGIVKEATRVEDGWTCVAKFLKDQHDREDLARFQREVRMQAQMDHRNIVPVVGINLTDAPPWFVMPRALVNLRQYLRQFSGEDALWVFEHLAKGVEYAHSNGVIHRDLKPENILLFAEGDGDLHAAVADFGLGRLIERDTPALTESRVGMGTKEYMAPEQFVDAKNADERSDIYSMGKMLYEVLTGKFPYPSMDHSLVPQHFVYIVQKATQDAPERRYQTVASLLDDLVLVARSRHEFAPAADTARQMVQQLVQDQCFDPASTEPLARFLLENADDCQMLLHVFPTLPDPILATIIHEHGDVFKPIVFRYDSEVSGNLAFSYCDVVAAFYEKVFHLSTNIEIRTLILRRLPSLGAEHNRFYVGHVLARILDGLTEPSLVIAARDALSEDGAVARWCAAYLDEVCLARPIRSILPKRT